MSGHCLDHFEKDLEMDQQEKRTGEDLERVVTRNADLRPWAALPPVAVVPGVP